MASSHRRLKLGIIGCGAIGSRIAISTTKELKDHFMVSALYDIDLQKSKALAARLRKASLVRKTLRQTIQNADFIIEAVNTEATRDIVKMALSSRKGILVMSVGRLLEEGGLFSLAKKLGQDLLVPSGAIAGLDAIRAARIAGITSVTLTTTKPPQGFKGNAYLLEKGINLSAIKGDKILFDGRVQDAVRAFPQNINVAAVLSLAVGDADKVRVRIIASPRTTRNTHEIIIEGASGRIMTRVDNVACPDNPKTSYLAVLSAIAALRQYGQHIKVGA